jgi:hypothetical protein
MSKMSSEALAHVRRPPWRTIYAGLLVLAMVGISYMVWQPGADVRDGRHDRGGNALWLQHGWLGDDGWFARNQRDKALFRTVEHVSRLREHCVAQHIQTVYPHLCPCDYDGHIASVDAGQTERFLDAFAGLRVIPWIGGVNEKQVDLPSSTWQSNFVASVVSLLAEHPRLAGVQINIEPLPSGDRDYIRLLETLKQAMPSNAVLSVAAYPPPTRWHPFPDVHWEEGYIREIAGIVNELAFMNYDTAITYPKLYESLMKKWTQECLDWSAGCDVLLGIPSYDDADSGYHDPAIENMHHALRGIHAGLASYPTLPEHYRGVAVYCEWETDAGEWGLWQEQFRAPGTMGDRPEVR